MAEYISKAAVAAEIERRIKEIEEIGTYLSQKGVLTNLLCHLDTIEVKEIQKKNLYVVTRCEEHSDYVEKAFFSEKKAEKYCKQFEGNKDAYGRDITEIEVDYPLEVKGVDLEKEFYDFLDTLIGKDNGHLSEDELFRIAEYFYELGLKAQKG